MVRDKTLLNQQAYNHRRRKYALILQAVYMLKYFTVPMTSYTHTHTDL